MPRILVPLLLVVVVAGCGLRSVLPGTIDPACRSHADPADCQAALEAAVGEIGLLRDGYVLAVQPITCDGGRCTTWVSAVPAVDDDCKASYEAEVTRDAFGPWAVSMSAHGDPPCAFEP
jgi:hypothetical protein